MSRLGMLYALNEEDVKKLRSVPEEERYEYMLEEIEEALIGSPRSCELDKAWEGIQYCLGGGQWNEDNCIPTNIVFGGEVLVETDDEIITLKNHQDVRDIVEYLHQNKLQEIIQKNFWNIDDENFMVKTNYPVTPRQKRSRCRSNRGIIDSPTPLFTPFCRFRYRSRGQIHSHQYPRTSSTNDPFLK